MLSLAGISGKFKWAAIDLTVLVLGAVTLLAGVAIMIALPMPRAGRRSLPRRRGQPSQAQSADQSPDFSARIRAGLPQPAP